MTKKYRDKMRTEKQREASRRNIKKANEVSRKLPRSLAQIENLRRMHSLPKTSIQIKHTTEMSKMPKTPEQIEIRRKNAYELGKRPKTQKQIQTSRKIARKMGSSNNADTTVKHHNDLCHGTERPDDITCMTLSEHTRLHINLRIEDGTHHFLTQNRKRRISV